MKTVFGYLNSFDFPNLSQFMHQHCTEDFIYCCKGDDNSRKMYVPKSLTLTGVESFMSFVTSIGDCVPDRTYILTETIIRNRVDCCFILSKFVVSGTAVFQVQIQDDDPVMGTPSEPIPMSEDIKCKKRRMGDVKQFGSISNNSSNNHGANSSTFHDLDVVSTELEITKKDQKFGVGNFLKSGSINGRYDGVASLFLNREGKIRRFEINFSNQREANWVKIVDHKKEN